MGLPDPKDEKTFIKHLREAHTAKDWKRFEALAALVDSVNDCPDSTSN